MTELLWGSTSHYQENQQEIAPQVIIQLILTPCLGLFCSTFKGLQCAHNFTSRYDLLSHASHYSKTAVFPVREMNPFADDLHKHLSVLCLPLTPNEFQALSVLSLFTSPPVTSCPFPMPVCRFSSHFLFLKLYPSGSGGFVLYLILGFK